MKTQEDTNTSTLGQTEKVSPVKSFRSNPDVENFYRFIYENGLRNEAKSCLEAVVKVINPPRKKKTRGRKKKIQ